MNKLQNHQNNIVHLSDAVADGKMDFIGEPESVLGHRLLPTYAGVLRSGIKVPYESGQNALSGKEKALYEKWISEGRSPREIEKELKKDLRPANVPYFSVYRSECKNNPEHADLIRALYGNSRGEVHRLRITFLSDKWWESIPHNLMAFRKSGLYCSSEPINGQMIATRDPEMDPEVEKKGKAKREFEKKKVTLACIPDTCPIYQANGCRFSGVLHFMILGVPGTDLWRLPTTSWYSVRGIKEKIDMFQSALAAKGRSIVGIPFELFKYEAEISRWDYTKGRIRSKQWIIRIDCPELPLADLIVQNAGFGTLQQKQAPMIAKDAYGSPAAQKTSEAKVDEVKLSVLPGYSSEGKENPKESSSTMDTVKIESEADKNKKEESVDNSKSHEKGNEKGDGNPSLAGEMTLEEAHAAILGELEPIGEVPLKTVQEYLSSIGKGHFKDLSLEEAKTLHQRVVKARGEKLEDKKTENAKTCSGCPSEISQEVEQYSLTHYRKPLCRSCQKMQKGSLPNYTTSSRKQPGQVPDAQF